VFITVYLPDFTEAFCTAEHSTNHTKDAQSVLGTDHPSRVIITNTVVTASKWCTPSCNGDMGKRASQLYTAIRHEDSSHSAGPSIG